LKHFRKYLKKIKLDLGLILKPNLSWSRTWAIFCQLSACYLWFYSNLIW